MKRHSFLFLVLGLGLFLAAGCRERESAVPVAKEPSNTFTERLNAATGIMDSTKRDDALVAVANAAAAGGEAEVVKQALRLTMDAGKRDAAAEACALALAKAGKRAEAVVIARQIMDAARRDRTLSRLATE